MQITSNSSHLQIYQHQKSDKINAEQSSTDARPKGPAPKNDSVHFSQDAKLLADAQSVASSSADVRADKVAQLREQVQNGTYQVDAQKIAENILREDMAIFAG